MKRHLDGRGESLTAAKTVVGEIIAAGGEAFANGADVSSAEQVNGMIANAVSRRGKLDIVVNNAGILRDRAFANMELADFRKVIGVHPMAARVSST